MSVIPKRFSMLTYKGLALIMFICFGLFYVTDHYITVQEDNEFIEQYGQITPGMQETMVVALLGASTDRTRMTDLGQGENANDVGAASDNKEPVYHLNWRRESGTVYTIGFDRRGAVVTKETTSQQP